MVIICCQLWSHVEQKHGHNVLLTMDSNLETQTWTYVVNYGQSRGAQIWTYFVNYGQSCGTQKHGHMLSTTDSHVEHKHVHDVLSLFKRINI